MSDFLTRLTERVQPGGLALRPVQPSRFEPGTTEPATQPFWRESASSFAVVDTQAAANQVAAKPNSGDYTVQVPPSTATAQATERQHQNPTTAAVTRTTQPRPEAREPFVSSEQPPLRRQAGEPPLGPEEVLFSASVPPARKTSSPHEEQRMKPANQEPVGRPTVRETSIDEEQSIQAQAECYPTRPEHKNLLPKDSFKAPRALLPIAEPPSSAKDHESLHIEREVKRELPYGPQETLPSRRLDFSPPKQGALLPAPAKPTPQSMDGKADFGLFAAPEIRVTIGRIEVRASVAAPSNPRLQAPRAPKSSLDDYLRSRKEAF